MKIAATNVVASQPPEQQSTATPTACAKILGPKKCVSRNYLHQENFFWSKSFWIPKNMGFKNILLTKKILSQKMFELKKD